MTARRRPALAGLLAAATLVAGGCQSLQFIDHGELVITFPPDRSTVALPLRVSWQAADLADGQQYAVFVDRAPQPPGRTIDEAFDVEDRGGIVLASSTEVLLEQLAIRGGVPERDRDRHDLTVVVLDADGRRVGEIAAFLEVVVDRSAR